jgi:molecular chaperone GrpE
MQKTDHDESEVAVEDKDGQQHAKEAEGAAQQAPLPDAAQTDEAEAQQAGLAATDDLATLQAELKQKEAEAKANYELFLRERAELENFKRRMQRDKSEALRFANEPLVRDLLPVVDNLERAIVHAQGGGNGQPLIEGVQLVLRAFLDVLERHGVTRVSATGEPFDPTRHEAVAQVETEDLPPNSVAEEHTPGYSLHNRLLRASMVSVSKAPAGTTETENESDAADEKSED